MQNAPQLVREVGYVPLPDEVYKLAYQRFLTNKTGSVFTTASTVGADLVKLMQEDQ